MIPRLQGITYESEFCFFLDVYGSQNTIQQEWNEDYPTFIRADIVFVPERGPRPIY